MAQQWPSAAGSSSLHPPHAPRRRGHWGDGPLLDGGEQGRIGQDAASGSRHDLAGGSFRLRQVQSSGPELAGGRSRLQADMSLESAVGGGGSGSSGGGSDSGEYLGGGRWAAWRRIGLVCWPGLADD
jgi:hypothetical protein